MSHLPRRLAVLALCAALGGAPGMASAQQSWAYEQISGQLRDQGFTITSVERTWLGRVRIVARSSVYDREIVFVPATGEILRDYWVARQGSQGTAGGTVGVPGGPGAGYEDDDDDDSYDDDEEDDEDDDDEDNSGSGGGDDEEDDDDEGDGDNSGSGSDNSGSGSDSSGSGSGSDDDE